MIPAMHSTARHTASTWSPGTSDTLQLLVDRAVDQVTRDFATSNFKTTDIAVTLLTMDDPAQPRKGSHRGKVQIYPASIIKIFYLAAVHQWIEAGQIEDSEEVRRAMHNMIVHSSNDATHYLIDLITDTTSGPELPTSEMEEWLHKRNAVNRYFAALGYQKVNANRKPWDDGPYGREMQSVQAHPPNHRNWLTTDEAARLLCEIANGKAVSLFRSQQMMDLLKHPPSEARQSFIAAGLPDGAELWSKDGWTSQTHHTAAYVQLPCATRFVLVVFTENHPDDAGVIAAVARNLVEGMG